MTQADDTVWIVIADDGLMGPEICDVFDEHAHHPCRECRQAFAWTFTAAGLNHTFDLDGMRALCCTTAQQAYAQVALAQDVAHRWDKGTL